MFTRKNVLRALAVAAAVAVYVATRDNSTERIHDINMSSQSEPAPDIAPVNAQSI